MGFDFFADMDQQAFCPVITPERRGRKLTVPALLELAQNEIRSGAGKGGGIGGLVLASGPENHPEALRWFWERGLLLGNSPHTLQQVRNPFRLAEAVRDTGVRFPETYPWEPGPRLPGGARRWLVKPLRGGGGRGIRPLPPAGRSRSGAVIAGEGTCVIQEFVPGLACSATFAADGKRAVVIGASLQLLAGRPERPFGYGGNIVPLIPPEALRPPFWRERLVEATRALTARFGLRGLNTVDFILNAEGIWILEVNPRWSGSVELFEQLRGKPLFPLHLSACSGEGLGDRDERGGGMGLAWGPDLAGCPGPACRGKAILYAPYDFKVSPEWPWEQLYRWGMRDIPQPGTPVKAGRPVCTVLAAGDSWAHCRRQLAAKLEWALRTLEGRRIQAVR